MSNPPLARWQAMLAASPRLAKQLAEDLIIPQSLLAEYMASLPWEEARSRIAWAGNTLIRNASSLLKSFRL